MATAINRNSGWAEIGWDVLLIVAGVLALALPPLAGIGFEILVGWLLLFGGVAHMVFAFRSRAESGGFIWKVLVGLAYVVCGIYFLLFPIGGMASLTLALAIFLLVEGALETILFFNIRPIPGAGWILFDGVLTLILGFLIWASWPASSLFAIGAMVGISLIVSGVSRLMLRQTVSAPIISTP